MSVLQPDHHPVIQEFHVWFSKSCCTGTLGPASEPNASFMPSTVLESYFKDTRRLTKILEALFETRYPPVLPEAIQGNYDKVLGILLCIGKGRFIQTFIEYHNLRDERLPFDDRPKNFPTEGSDELFFDAFYRKQWTFCPPVFHRGKSVRHDSNCILPIIFKEELSGGASAIVYKITLHESYNRLRDTGDSEQQGQSDGTSDVFVLKTYKTKNAEQYYKSEVDGFKRLSSTGGGLDPNMIGFYGSYIQDDSYNVILDFADEGTLEQYFRNHGQPSAEDILPFWRELFGVIKPLARIHGISPNSSAESPAEMDIFLGWHQDVKPSNIFIKGNPDSAYKRRFILADLGLSHFRSKTQSQESVTDEDTRGTRTYGAPECYRADDFIQRIVLNVKQKVDIWSLACVFSEAATWLLRGYDGILNYRQLRMEEIAKIGDFRDHDCFHNGEEVLSTVGKWHRSISDDIRRGDYITAMVLELIGEMFWDVNSRPDSMQLWKKSQEIVKKAERPFLELRVPSGHQFLARRSSDPSLSPPHTPPELPPNSTFIPQSFWQPGRASCHKGNWGPGAIGGLRSGDRPHSSGRMTGSNGPSARHSRGGNSRDPYLPSGSASDFHRVWDKEPQYHGPPPRNLHSRDIASRRSSVPVNAMNGRDPGGLFGQAVDPNPIPPDLDRTSPTYSPPALSPDLPDCESPPTMVSENWKPPPFLSVEAAQHFVAAKKAASQGTVRRMARVGRKKTTPDLLDQDLLDRLNDRDHIFLVDDGESMRKHWLDVISLFKTLGYMVKPKDPDGIELRFTNSLLWGRSRDRKHLVELLEKKVQPKGNTDISIRLGQILDDYAANLRKQNTAGTKSVRPMNIYIFTDGVWQPQCDYDTPIKRLVTTLENLGSPEKQVGIQFVRFGDEPVGMERLEYLDKGLKKSRDIVDTEPFPTGNVWKMFLGPLDPWFDGDKNPSPDFAGGSSSPPAAAAVNGAESTGSGYNY